MLDPKTIRKDFPILSRQVRGKPLVYLDNAATTQRPLAVMEALETFYREWNSNIHRGIHHLSEGATAQFEKTRDKVAEFIDAPEREGIIFTRNATESINLVAYSWVRKNLKPGDEVLVTEMEHHSNLVPWQLATQAAGATLRHIPVTSDGFLDLSQLDRLLTRKTKFLAFTAMSNVLGTINPVKQLVQAAHAVGAKVLVDAAQAVPHFLVSVEEWGCDFLAFSAHKMLGPTGVGILYGKTDLLEEMDPFLGGGDMISEVWLDHARWNELPWKFEAGTPNIADVIAFSAALDYLNGLGMEEVRAHEITLTRHTLDKLRQLPSVILYGPKDSTQRGGVISFNVGDIHPHDLGTLLDEEGIAIRAGHHCCQPLMKKYGISGTARASFYIYNTLEEVDTLVRSIQKVPEVFAGAGRS